MPKILLVRFFPDTVYECIYSVSQKKSTLRTCGNFSKTVRNFSTKFYTSIMRFLSTLDYEFYSIICNFDKVMPY